MNYEMLKNENEKIKSLNKEKEKYWSRENIISSVFQNAFLVLLGYFCLMESKASFVYMFEATNENSALLLVSSLILFSVAIFRSLNFKYEYYNKLSLKKIIYYSSVVLFLFFSFFINENFSLSINDNSIINLLYYNILNNGFDLNLIVLCIVVPLYFSIWILKKCFLMSKDELSKSDENLLFCIFFSIILWFSISWVSHFDSMSFLKLDYFYYILYFTLAISSFKKIGDFILSKNKIKQDDMDVINRVKIKEILNNIEGKIKTLEDLEYYELYLIEKNYKLEPEIHEKMKKIKNNLLEKSEYKDFGEYRRYSILRKKEYSSIENL